MLIVALISMRN